MGKRFRLTVGVSGAVAAAALLWLVAFRESPQPPRRIVKAGVYENAPKIYTASGGEPAGLFVELLQAIAQEEGWELEYVACTWAECLELVAAGAIDLMPDVAYSAERAQRLDFHAVAAANSWSQVYRSPKLPIRSIADLNDRKVAVLNQAVQQHYIEQLMTGTDLRLTLLPVEAYDDGFAAVRDGRADAVVTNGFFGSRFAKPYGLVETPIIFNAAALYFATAKGQNGPLLERIDHHLSAWRDDPDSPYFAALRNAMAPPPITVVPRWLQAAVAAAGLAALLSLAFNFLLRWQVRRATEALQETHLRLTQVLNASPVVLFLLRPDGGSYRTEWISPNIERIFGFSAGQAAAPGWLESRLHPEDRETFLANRERLPGSGQLTQEYRILDAGGRTRYIHDELRIVDSGDGPQAICTWTDLTEAVKQAAELRFLTQYEPLTGLPNRARLNERLNKIIGRAGRKSAKAGVLLIDLDRFRHLNDTLGHVQGDALLRVAAKKLEALARFDDTVARIGGDSFVLVLGGDTSAAHAARMAQQILDVFNEPLTPDHPLIVTASVGVSIYPDDGADADTLLKHAEAALYEAKKTRNAFRVYAPELSAKVEGRMVMETALRGAAARDELVLHYQPQVDLSTGELIGVEALVRWNRPGAGLLLPNEFIPLAEEAGIIQDIGAWVVATACRQMKAWAESGFEPGYVAVNLSVRQLEGGTLAAQIAGVLRQSGLPAAKLELEITETAIMREPDKAVTALRELKALGVTLTIDDFGTGHSSLAYLKRLPIDHLKVDQIFVRDIGRDAGDEAICRTVIELGRNLGLRTIAEGVEREEQAAFLRAEGCSYAQGYLFGRPLPADALQNAWRARTAAPGGV